MNSSYMCSKMAQGLKLASALRSGCSKGRLPSGFTLYKDRWMTPCQLCVRKFHFTKNVGNNSESDIVQVQSQSDDNPKISTTKDLLDGATGTHKHDIPEFPSDINSSVDRDSEVWKRSQSKHGFRPKINPRETSILLFPGQGSQFLGMGRELLNYPNVEDMFTVSSEILGYDLLDLCLNGPLENLNKTVHCQPATLVTSLAAVEKLKHIQPWAIEHCITAAGFSIGEYAALVFAGCLSFEDAVKVVKARAEAMQEASEETPSGMMTVFLGHKSKLKFACHTAKQYCADRMNIEKPVCEVANYLYPECKVIAGNIQALDFIEQNSREFSLLRTKRLPVSGAFHTPLMASAQKKLRQAIQRVDLQTPVIPVHSNVNSYKYKNTNIVERLLAEQVCQPVKWEQTLHVIYSRPVGDDYPYTFEMGPGKQLGAILGKVNHKAKKQYQAVGV